jgi:hypothetical protein
LRIYPSWNQVINQGKEKIEETGLSMNWLRLFRRAEASRMGVVRNNRIATLPADGLEDCLHGVQGTAPLDNKVPSSDNSSA